MEKNWKEKWSALDGIKYLYDESGKRFKGIKHGLVFLDGLASASIYGATFHDYINLRFYMRSRNARKSFITTSDIKKEKKKWKKEDIEKIDNKGLFNKNFAEFIGREWHDLDECTFEQFEDFTDRNETFFLKPKRESSGIGIKKIVTKDIPDLRAFYRNHPGCLVEEVVVLCKEMKALNPESISQIRIVTVKNGTDDVHILASTLRTGGKNTQYNTAKDDIFSQINIETGKCFTRGVDENAVEYEAHPVSGIPFIGFQIPHWDWVISACTKAAKMAGTVTIIGWDVAIRDNDVIFFEGNPGSGVASMQISDGIGKKELLKQYL